jgi:hypothetical protein
MSFIERLTQYTSADGIAAKKYKIATSSIINYTL